MCSFRSSAALMFSSLKTWRATLLTTDRFTVRVGDGKQLLVYVMNCLCVFVQYKSESGLSYSDLGLMCSKHAVCNEQILSAAVI